ncbi:hypothetical protein RV06_GL000837 [Enterococcus haemoperoxidus]|nr:hypothetical protein RV06_GL000837 [Enterococcus haemoperoxidus]
MGLGVGAKELVVSSYIETCLFYHSSFYLKVMNHLLTLFYRIDQLQN